MRRRGGLSLSVGTACGLLALWQRRRQRLVSGTMNGFSSEERAAPFTLEYRVFFSECRRPRGPSAPARPFIPGPRLASRLGACGPRSAPRPGRGMGTSGRSLADPLVPFHGWTLT